MELPTLKDLFYQHEGKLIHKWDHYFDIYEKYFSAYRNQPINMLEIGISHGGSMQLWKKYFGKLAHIYAIDVNPECKKLEEENTTIFIGSQSDKAFLKKVSEQIPALDIILDDGGHTMLQQKVTLETLFFKVKDGGLYMVEDTHTSYWSEFGGGLKKAGNFIEYSKNFIDSIYENHIINKSRLTINDITRHINSISFYDSIVVFEKQKRETPFHLRKGNETITPNIPKLSLLEKAKAKIFGKTKHPFELADKGKI